MSVIYFQRQLATHVTKGCDIPAANWYMNGRGLSEDIVTVTEVTVSIGLKLSQG